MHWLQLMALSLLSSAKCTSRSADRIRLKVSAAGIQNFVRNDANSTPKHAHRGHHADVGRLEDPYFAPFAHGGAVLTSVIGLFYYLRIVVTLFSAVPEPQPSTQRLDWSTAFLLGGLAVLLADTGRSL
jgi:hypothetical protein